MTTNRTSRRSTDRFFDLLFVIAMLTVGSVGCEQPASPIPHRAGPLVLELRYPQDGTRILQDSTAVWGTVGSGDAGLEVNGVSVPVEPNGTFALFVPVPEGDTALLTFTASLGSDTIRTPVRIDRTAGQPAAEDAIEPFARWVRMSRLRSDTVDSATQARPIYTRWRPGGGLALPIEQGIRVFANARTGSAYRLRIAPDLFVWAAATEVDTLAGSRDDLLRTDSLRIEDGSDETVLSLTLSEPLPTSVEAMPGGLVWTIFGATQAGPVPVPAGLVADTIRMETGNGRTILEIPLAADPLGYRVEWRSGRLALRIRRPRAQTGFEGLIVALDPGHPPGGTVGPGGLREDSMTLAVARAAAELLRGHGASPVLLRDDDEAVSLDERIVRAERAGAHVLISIHGNSPGPGRPPRAVDGTAVYWIQPMSFTLGRAMLDGVTATMGQPRIGNIREDFAVTRTTWYPAVLVEGVGLVLPETEARLRTREGVELYARGLVNGLELWLERQRRRPVSAADTAPPAQSTDDGAGREAPGPATSGRAP